MRLYFGDDMKRAPRQYRAKRIGYKHLAQYNPQLRLWMVWELDADGNTVVQANGEETIYFPSKDEMLSFVFGWE